MKLLVYFILLCSFFSYRAQNLTDFNYLGDNYSADETYLSAAISRSKLTNLAAPYSENHTINGFTGTIDLKKVTFKKGQKRFFYEHKLIGDLFMLSREILFKNHNAIYRQESSNLSCGILGWAAWTWNINTPKKNSLAIGFNLHDYFLTSTYVVDSSSSGGKRKSLEPQGYWFTAGPKLVYNRSISKHFILEAATSYSISYWRVVSLSYATVDDNYPKPHFGQARLEVLSSIGFFAGFDYNWVINRGDLPNSTKRFDALFGFRFML